MDLRDEVVRGSIILNEGTLLWPPPPVVVQAPPFSSVQSQKVALDVIEDTPTPYQKALKKVGYVSLGVGSVSALGLVSPNANFTHILTTFGLSGIIGELCVPNKF